MESGPHYKRFLIAWLIAGLVIAAVIAAFDALVDPYLLFDMPRIAGFNAEKPAVETDEKLMKAYQVLRTSPRTVVLGTSRVDLGLDAQSPRWPKAVRPVYDLGIAGGNLSTSLRYLQQVLAGRSVALVVVGLDFEYFLTARDTDPGADTGFEARLAVRADGTRNPDRRIQMLRDFAHVTLSLDALEESVTTVADNLHGESPNLYPSGDISAARLRRNQLMLGPRALFTELDLDNLRLYRGKGVNRLAWGDLKRILDLCEAHGARMMIFINPVHADVLETYALLGDWNAFENWKRSLVALTEQYREPGGTGPVPLWDFSGYDEYSTESVASRGRTPLEWFLGPDHYTKRLGDMMLGRMFGTADSGYGTLLTPLSLEARIAAVRAGQLEYRERQPADVRRVIALYDEVMGASPHETVRRRPDSAAKLQARPTWRSAWRITLARYPSVYRAGTSAS